MTWVRWGVIGASRIAQSSFIPGLRSTNSGEVFAVASRSLDKAKQFASDNQIPTAYGSYQELIEDPNLDAIYVALPPILHAQTALDVVRAGKAVLSEKPFATSGLAAKEFVEKSPVDALAWEAFVFAFHPQTSIPRDLINELGPVKSIYSHFVYTPSNPNDFRSVGELGGGALLDVGSYCLRFAQLLMNSTPTLISANSRFNDLGANDEGSAVFQYPDNVEFKMHWSNKKAREQTALVEYRNGSALFNHPFSPNADSTITINAGGSSRVIKPDTRTTWYFALTHINQSIAGLIPPSHQIKDFSIEQATLLEQIQALSLDS